MSLIEGLLVTAANKAHLPFVVGAWIKSMRLEYKDVDEDLYYEWAKRHCAELVETSDVLVAVDPEDPDNIIGFIVYKNGCLAWAYVRKDWRANNVFRTLKEVAGIDRYSHRSHSWNHRRSGLPFIPWSFSTRRD